jgi:hypothetical protein
MASPQKGEFSVDNSIITFPLKNSKEYVAALTNMGLLSFKEKKKTIFVNGMPLDGDLKRVIRSELRDHGYQVRRGWLNDILLCLASGHLDIWGQWHFLGIDRDAIGQRSGSDREGKKL